MSSSPREPQSGPGRMAPPPPRRPKRSREPPSVVVLEEEDWIAKMEGIIERDFFPELGKLQDKVAWMEAVRSGDPELIRAAQLRIAHRQQSQQQQHHPGTSGGGRGTPQMPTAAREGDTTPGMSLDTFLAHHTSEDNASFSSILERTNKRRRERAAVLLAPSNDPKALITDGREQSDGFGSTGQPIDTLAGWKYTPVNLLMYDGATQDSLPLSKRERAGLVPGPPPKINHAATRLLPQRPPPSSSSLFASRHQRGGSETPSTSIDTTTSSVITTTSEGDDGSHEARGGNLPTITTTTTNEYAILSTPSFDPGVDASPFMTWGEIEATPMRIEDGEDVPFVGGGGGASSFRIKETPRREQVGHVLATKAGASLRRRGPGGSRSAARGTARGGGGGLTPVQAAAMAALGRAPPQSTGRLGGTGGSGTGTPLSHAAQRLVGRIKKASGAKSGGGGGGGGAIDGALRASYGRTPVHSLDSGSAEWESTHTPSHGGGGGSKNWTPQRTPKSAKK